MDSIVSKMLSSLHGEDWKRVRSIVSPTFSTGKIKRVMSIFKDCSKTLLQNFKVAIQKGDQVEVQRVYGAFTMDVIASSAFSTKIDSHNDPNNEFVKAAKSIFVQESGIRFLIFLTMPLFVTKFLSTIFDPQNSGLEFFLKMQLYK